MQVTQCVSLRTEIKQFFKKKKTPLGPITSTPKPLPNMVTDKMQQLIDNIKNYASGKKNFPGQCLTSVTFMKKGTEGNFLCTSTTCMSHASPQACFRVSLQEEGKRPKRLSLPFS